MDTFLLSISKVLSRDLDLLEKEIKQYPSDESVWRIGGDIKNSGGNLCLHLCGNLQHFIGAILGETGYVRHRENEFGAKGLLKDELIQEINLTKESVKSTIPKINPAFLDNEYPVRVFNEPMTTRFFLIHLAGHLNYHLGQINYLRRLMMF